MQISTINKPTWFLNGFFLGVLITLVYTNLMAEPAQREKECPACQPLAKTSTAVDRFCPSCPVCPDGSKPGPPQGPHTTKNNVCPKCPEPEDCPVVKAHECPPPPKCPICHQATSSQAKEEDEEEEGTGLRAPRQGVSRTQGPLVETPDGQHLGLVQPLYELENGQIKLPQGIKRIAVDVGTSLYSPSSAGWFKRFPQDMMVLMFEPNKFSHSLIAYTSHPTMAMHPKRFVFFSTSCKTYDDKVIGPTLTTWYTHCMNTTYGHLVRNRQHMVIANAAMTNQNGFASFNLGVGDPGVGSLYDFKPGTEWTKPSAQHENWGKSHVPKIRLDSVLQYLPEDVTLEVLKIDAQGHDAEVVAGAGKYLSRFKCLIGEFDTSGYQGADHKGFHHKQLLNDAGFREVGGGAWVNKKYAKSFEERDYVCQAYDVKPRHDTLIKALLTDNF